MGELPRDHRKCPICKQLKPWVEFIRFCNYDERKNADVYELSCWCTACKKHQGLKRSSPELFVKCVACRKLVRAECNETKPCAEKQQVRLSDERRRIRRQYRETGNREKAAAPGQIYIVAHPKHPGCVKIGKAGDAKRRLRDFQIACPHRAYYLIAAFQVADMDTYEAKVHQSLISARLQGEWFTIEWTDARQKVWSIIHVLDQTAKELEL